MTYYELLNISPSANHVTIEQAYCSLLYSALPKLRSPTLSLQEKINVAAHIRLSTDAYASLIQPKVRQAYDLGLAMMQQMCAICEGRGHHEWNGIDIKCVACGGNGKSN